MNEETNEWVRVKYHIKIELYNIDERYYICVLSHRWGANRPMIRPMAIKFLAYLLLHVSKQNRKSDEGEDLYLQNGSATVYKKVSQSEPKGVADTSRGFRWARVRFSLFLSISLSLSLSLDCVFKKKVKEGERKREEEEAEQTRAFKSCYYWNTRATCQT